MNVYIVRGTYSMEVYPDYFVEVENFYGVFSSQSYADQTADDLRKHIAKNKSREEIIVKEYELNKKTNDYYITISAD